jgi:carbon storage regulator
MLILMRRPGESIHIGPNIVVTLVSLERNRARIGVEAPREIAVDREEIAELKKGNEPDDSEEGDAGKRDRS